MNDQILAFEDSLSKMNRAHPWHGVSPGPKAPTLVETFIEMVPTDVVKYELDKVSGHLRIDRPQRFSSKCPTLYGFIPQTYCGDLVAGFCQTKVRGYKDLEGDGDPLDICVLSECAVTHGDIFVRARPIGGLRMIDGGKVDDKIVAVLDEDAVFGNLRDISKVPEGLVSRLKHYFLSYKNAPDVGSTNKVEITAVYGRQEAFQVIRHSIADYLAKFGTPESRIAELREMIAQGVIEELAEREGSSTGRGKKTPRKR